MSEIKRYITQGRWVYANGATRFDGDGYSDPFVSASDHDAAMAKAIAERDKWGRKWHEIRQMYAELRYPGMKGLVIKAMGASDMSASDLDKAHLAKRWDLMQERDAAQSALAAARLALETYGVHHHGCPIARRGPIDNSDCNCGLDAALASQPTAEGDGA